MYNTLLFPDRPVRVRFVNREEEEEEKGKSEKKEKKNKGS